jgi:hypothetical protein
MLTEQENSMRQTVRVAAVFLVADVLGHLRFESGFEDGFGELVEQPARPDQVDPLFFALASSCSASFLVSAASFATDSSVSDISRSLPAEPSGSAGQPRSDPPLFRLWRTSGGGRGWLTA